MLGLRIEKVSGITGLSQRGETISAARCFFNKEEHEKYIIWRGDLGLRVREVHDVFEINDFYDVPGILKNLPITGIARFNDSVLYLLDFDRTITFCQNKGENHGE